MVPALLYAHWKAMRHAALYFNLACSFVPHLILYPAETFLPHCCEKNRLLVQRQPTRFALTMDVDKNVISRFHRYNNSCISAVVYWYLLVNFSKLLQVVFQKGNLLFLGDISPAIIRLPPCTLSTETEEILGHEYCASQKQMCTQSW